MSSTRNKSSSTDKATKKLTSKNDNVSDIENKSVSELMKKKTKHKIYIGFYTRLIFNIILFILFTSLGTMLLINSFKFESEKLTKYSEKSNLDYKVYLKNNDFYEQDYLGKDMLYVANLIDNIAIDFDYLFTSDKIENLDFTYDVIGKLSITNETGTKSFFEKNYTLLENKKVSMANSNTQNIKEHLVIDYPYYNSLANGFKSQYGINTVSKLTVYMIINKKNTNNSNFKLDSNNVMNVTIPLSERAVDISLDYKEINDTNNIVEKQDVLLQSVTTLVVALLLIILALIMMVKAMRKISLITNKKNKYDKFVKRKLREYDRLIAESNSMISLDDKEVIKINKFEELLDIHDNLGLPIMYYEVAKHQKGYFYICHGNIVYLNTVKDVDLDNRK